MRAFAEKIKAQPASNIELLPCAYLTGINGAVLSVSNVSGFANGQAITIQPNNGSPSKLTLAASNAVDTVNSTLTLTGTPSEVAGTNEVQTLTGSATVAGKYALGFEGYFTPALANTSNAAAVQAALEALPNIGTGNVAVSGGPLNTTTAMTVTFQGALAKKDVSLIVVNAQGLTAGTISVAETTKGVPYSAIPSINSTILGPSLIELGGTTGGVQATMKPEILNVQYDQVETDVEALRTFWNADVRFTLQEFDLKQWGYLSQFGYSLRVAGTGVTGATIVNNLGQTLKYGVRFTFDKQDESSALKDYLLFYRVSSIEGIETAFQRGELTNLPVGFHALGDPQRPRNKRVFEFIEETAAAT